MADYEDGIFSNLPRSRRRPGERDGDDRRLSPRQLLAMNFVPEGPLPQRPRPSGKGGPSVNQGVTPPVTSVWSASDATASGMTLSNGGLTIAGTAANSGYGIVRNTISQTSGKLYIEFKANAALASPWQLGLANAGMVNNNYLGSANYSAGENINNLGAFASAGFVANSSQPASPIHLNVGDVVAIAIDFTGGNIWLGVNNVWLTSGNPVTGVNSFFIFSPATVGPLFAALAFANGIAYSWTLQPTGSSQSYAPPAGFTPWG